MAPVTQVTPATASADMATPTAMVTGPRLPIRRRPTIRLTAAGIRTVTFTCRRGTATAQFRIKKPFGRPPEPVRTQTGPIFWIGFFFLGAASLFGTMAYGTDSWHKNLDKKVHIPRIKAETRGVHEDHGPGRIWLALPDAFGPDAGASRDPAGNRRRRRLVGGLCGQADGRAQAGRHYRQHPRPGWRLSARQGARRDRTRLGLAGARRAALRRSWVLRAACRSVSRQSLRPPRWLLVASPVAYARTMDPQELGSGEPCGLAAKRRPNRRPGAQAPGAGRRGRLKSDSVGDDFLVIHGAACLDPENS